MLDLSGICPPDEGDYGLPLDGVPLIADLQWLHTNCQKRMLTDGVSWVDELVAYLPEQWITKYEESTDYIKEISTANTFSVENREVALGRSLLTTGDFPRASFFLSKSRERNSITKFLYFWSRYLTCLRDQAEADAESFDKTGSRDHDKDTTDMIDLLQEIYADKKLNPASYDPFLLYLLGRVEASSGMKSEAYTNMKIALEEEPRLWPAWQEMVNLVDSRDDLDSVCSLEMTSRHAWMSDWFACLTLARLNCDRSAIGKAKELLNRGLYGVPMILSHMAACSNRVLDHNQALSLFADVREKDPLRLENMHLYSDSLFCGGERVQLTALTHAFYKTHKFTWQTCCIVGNYYNMRREHEQAIRFFQRALRLNPTAAGIWVLIGHEFLELKNNAAACMSYRKAIEVDSSDCRGWYGLGQMYDILKMHTYALYYYQEAHKCKPQDSRMLVALGVIYGKMSRPKDAQKCFTLAYKYGDVEGNALWHLAKLFENEGMYDQAARTYETYVSMYDDVKDVDDNNAYGLQFLAKHFCEKDDLVKASKYAQRCLENENISEEGRAVLRQVTVKKEAQKSNQELLLRTPRRKSLDESEGGDMAISDGDDDISFE